MDTYYFHVLAIVNSAAVNTGVRVSMQIRVFVFSMYMLRNGIAGSYGNSIFSFLKSLHIAFNSGCSNLHSYCHFTRVSSSPTFVICGVFFYDSHSDRHEVIPCGFSLHFSDA